MKERKGKIVVTVIVIMLVLALIPIKLHLKDGGSIVYQALLYRLVDYHVISPEDDTYLVGKEFKVFPFNFLDDYYEVDLKEVRS